jgi:hypothetical protein
VVDIPRQLLRKAELAKAGGRSWATVRRLLKWFGGQTLSPALMQRIDQALYALNLRTEPDYQSVSDWRRRVAFVIGATTHAEGETTESSVSPRAPRRADSVKRTASESRVISKGHIKPATRPRGRKLREDPPLEVLVVEAWAVALDHQKDLLQRKIDADGGWAEVLVLQDRDGKPVACRCRNTRFGMCWELLDGRFGLKPRRLLPYRSKRRLPNGLVEVRRRAPAIAAIISVDGSRWSRVEAIVDPDWSSSCS